MQLNIDICIYSNRYSLAARRTVNLTTRSGEELAAVGVDLAPGLAMLISKAIAEAMQKDATAEAQDGDE